MSRPLPLQFHPSAKKDIGDLEKNDRLRVYDKITDLTVNCRPEGYRHVAGEPGTLRIRVGDIRVTYICENLIYVKSILPKSENTYEISKRRN